MQGVNCTVWICTLIYHKLVSLGKLFSSLTVSQSFDPTETAFYPGIVNHFNSKYLAMHYINLGTLQTMEIMSVCNRDHGNMWGVGDIWRNFSRIHNKWVRRASLKKSSTMFSIKLSSSNDIPIVCMKLWGVFSMSVNGQVSGVF